MRKFWSRPERRKNGRKTIAARFGIHLLALAILVVTTVCGFFLAFPDAALQHRLEQELTKQFNTPIRVGHAQLAFPGGLEIDQLTVAGTPPLPLNIDKVHLRPVWTTLLAEQPGCNFDITSNVGTINGTIDSDRRLTASAADIPLSLPLPGMTSLTLNGTLANGSANLQLSAVPDEATQLSLTVEKLLLTGLKQLTGKGDELPLGRLDIDIKGVKGNYYVEKLQLAGGAIEATGNLTMTPVTPIEASRLNGNLILKPTDKLAPEITELLPLLGKNDRSGNYRLRLSGTLFAPRLR